MKTIIMKKYLLLVFVLLLTIDSTAQSVRLIAKSDSGFYSGSYHFQDSTHYAYSFSRDLLHAESAERPGLSPENLIWAPDEELFMAMGVNSILHQHEYDGDARIIRSYGAGWNGVAWDTGSVTIYHYTNGLCDTTYVYEWLGVGQPLKPMSREIRTYVVFGISTIELQLWNSNINVYENEKKETYQYYVTGKLSEIYTAIWDGSSYALYAYTDYHYNGDNVDTVTNAFYSGGWIFSTREAYAYDVNNDVTLTVMQSWQNNTWASTHRQHMTYDGQHNMLTLMEEEWTGNAWKNSFLENCTYTSANYIETRTKLPWDSLSAQFAPQQGSPKAVYYYETFDPASLGIATKHSNSLQVYPNPASGAINISLLSNQSKPFSLTIYDATGKAVKHWNEAPTTFYQKQVDVSGLPSGNYFLRIDNQPEEMVKFTIMQ
jgi:hypothetical protein